MNTLIENLASRILFLCNNHKKVLFIQSLLDFPEKLSTSEKSKNPHKKMPRWITKNVKGVHWLSEEKTSAELEINGYKMFIKILTSLEQLTSELENNKDVLKPLIVIVCEQAMIVHSTKRIKNPVGKNLIKMGYKILIIGGIKKQNKERLFSLIWGTLSRKDIIFKHKIQNLENVKDSTPLERLFSFFESVFDFPETHHKIDTMIRTGKLSPVLMICSHYTENGEDLSTLLFPDFSDAAIEYISKGLMECADILEQILKIIIPDENLFNYPIFRKMLPPPLWNIPEKTLIKKLNINRILNEEISYKFNKCGIKTQLMSYVDYINKNNIPELEEYSMKSSQVELCKKIYLDRASRYPFYAKYKMELGIQRAVGNSILYYGIAKILTKSIDLIIDAENDKFYWLCLKEGIKNLIRQPNISLPILALPKKYRQPWSAVRDRTPPNKIMRIL